MCERDHLDHRSFARGIYGVREPWSMSDIEQVRAGDGCFCGADIGIAGVAVGCIVRLSC